MFDKIAIGIKTFLRDEKLFHAIEGIEKHFPGAQMIIADDGHMSEEKFKIYRSFAYGECHKVIQMQFDSGFGAKSNAIANALERPYLLVASDDFDFSPVSVGVGIQKMQDVLDQFKSISVVSGRVNQRAYEFFLEEKDGIIREIPVPEIRTTGGYICGAADLTVNYSLIRKEVFEKVRWDNDARIGNGEHGAFFVDLKRAGFKVGYLPEVNINEQEGRDSDEYRSYRNRASLPSRSCFVKRGIKKYILGDGTVDYEVK